MNKIGLNKGIIYLMLPFTTGSGLSPESFKTENKLWTKTGEDAARFDFLLEHVKGFFTRNINTRKVDDSACLIMKLNKDTLPLKMFNNKIYLVSNKAFGNQQTDKDNLTFAVSIDPGAFRIILHPFTSIAILLFNVELVRHDRNANIPNLYDLIQLNYLLRLFNRHDEAYFISLNERPEERNKAAGLITGQVNDLTEKTKVGKIEITGWRPGQLVNYLLHDLNSGHDIELVDHHHFSPVCYVQPASEIREEEIVHRALFYLRKVYDFDYSPGSDVLQSEEELFHPYKQIYYASSLEGSIVLNNCSESDPEFIRNFYSNSFPKSLWLTILGFMQRSIFLQLLKEVSDIDPDDHNKVKEYLRRYTNISLKAIFSKVSVFHQHNFYYDLIIRNLQIQELQTELKDELHELNNLQRQFHEDEVERHEEIEKQYDKKLNIILFALSVLGLAQVTYSVLEYPDMSFLQHSMAIGIPLLLGILFWKFLSYHKN